MLFNNLSKTLKNIEKLIERDNQTGLTHKENDSIDCIDFSIAQSIINDLGKTTSLEIAHHIIAHYIE